MSKLVSVKIQAFNILDDVIDIYVLKIIVLIDVATPIHMSP